MAKREKFKVGERRVAAILFSDMKGFSSLSERMDPEEIDSLMNRFFGDFERTIKAHGGMVEKYIGDALVAVFGVPEMHEDDSSRAIHSALEFLACVKEASASLPSKGINPSFRTGIHSGLIATGRRGEFDVVTGHAMSIAQRLEAEAAPGSILVSESVKSNCSSEFSFSEPIELIIKGSTDPVIAYTVQGISIGELSSGGPLLGRKETLDMLIKAYVRSGGQDIPGLCLTGEAGIGKTRIAQAFIEKIRRFPDFSSPVLVARAQKYRSGRYSVVVELILDYLGLETTADYGKIQSSFASLPSLPVDTAGIFEKLLRARDGSAVDNQAVFMLYAIFQAILERYAHELFPLVIVIDNAHSMDRSSRDFFHYLIRTCPYRPFFFLAARDFPQALRSVFPGMKANKLAPLAENDARALILSIWAEAHDKAIEHILASSSGNPLFLTEYAEYARKHHDASALPETIQNIFLTSIERYEAPARELIKKLSVFAVSFSTADARFVQGRTGNDPGTTEMLLDTFIQDGILVRRKQDYAFRLDVFKKALYSSLLNYNKCVLHGVVADLMAQDENPDAVRIIFHLSLAERFDEAFRVMLADPYKNYTYEYLDYIDVLYKRLVRTDPDAAMHLLITKSALLFNSGKIDDAENELKHIMEIAVAQKNDNCMGFAYHQICAYNVISYAFQKARFTGIKALYYYGRANMHPKSVQNVMRSIALSETMRNNFDEARRIMEQMEKIPDRDDFEYAIAFAEYLVYSGDYHGSLNEIERALERIGPQAHPARFFALDIKIKALWQLCDFKGTRDAALELLETGSLSEGIRAQAHAMHALASLFLGDKDASRDSFAQAEFFMAQVRNDFDRIEALKTLALCHHRAHGDKKAESYASEGLILGLRHSCYYPAFTLAIILAEIKSGQGLYDEAKFFLKEASYFFTTGHLLPCKDVILYYHYASLLLDKTDSRNNSEVARRLLEEEKAKLAKPELIASFFSMDSFSSLRNSAPGRTK